MRSESKNAVSAVLSTEGRVVGICWEKLKPKGPQGDILDFWNVSWARTNFGPIPYSGTSLKNQEGL